MKPVLHSPRPDAAGSNRQASMRTNCGFQILMGCQAVGEQAVQHEPELLSAKVKQSYRSMACPIGWFTMTLYKFWTHTRGAQDLLRNRGAGREFLVAFRSHFGLLKPLKKGSCISATQAALMVRRGSSTPSMIIEICIGMYCLYLVFISTYTETALVFRSHACPAAELEYLSV